MGAERWKRQGSPAGWVALALLATAPAAAQGPLPEPIPEGVAIELVDFVQVPPSSFLKPLARINLLSHAGDGSGRLFINDMRGKIWVIDGMIRVIRPLACDDPGCSSPPHHPNCGRGFSLALLVPSLVWLRGRSSQRRVEPRGPGRYRARSGRVKSVTSM